jgi:hypothetical protein
MTGDRSNFGQGAPEEADGIKPGTGGKRIAVKE